MLALVACSALLMADAPAPDPASGLRRDYDDARASAGRSPDDQVRLALWCEAHGLPAERLKHLALAVLADPGHAAARGLLGLVARDGRWQRPEAVAARLGADPVAAATLADYDARRQKATYTAEGHWALGLWADEHGLKDQARAHFTAVIRLDPSHENARRRLGYKRHDGRWATDAQLVAERGGREEQRVADLRWKPRLERLKAMLAQSRRDEALADLATLTDPRAVPSIARVFLTDRAADQALAVQLLGQVDSPAASKTLAALAVLAPSAETRRLAIETLKRRDARDFVRSWIALIRKPVKFEVKPVGGPGSPGELFVEGEKANLRRRYAPKPMQFVPNTRDTTLDYDANGLPVLVQYLERDAFGNFRRLFPSPTGGLIVPPNRNPDMGRNTQIVENRVPVGQMMVEAQKSFLDARGKLAADVAALDRSNADAARANEPVLLALREVTGGTLGNDPTAWARWWTDREGYALAMTSTTTVPTVVEDVQTYMPTVLPGPVTDTVRSHHSCFAAGTLVRAIDGPKPIETIRAGDLVLVQDAKSGALSYQPVVAPYHNPPSPTLRVTVGEETIVATGIHRFWKAGKGWTMARDLKAGDPIRVLGGTAPVAAVVDDKVQPVFNFEVAEGRSFFVGTAGALVHDNTTVEPVLNPFDAAPASLAARGK